MATKSLAFTTSGSWDTAVKSYNKTTQIGTITCSSDAFADIPDNAIITNITLKGEKRTNRKVGSNIIVYTGNITADFSIENISVKTGEFTNGAYEYHSFSITPSSSIIKTLRRDGLQITISCWGKEISSEVYFRMSGSDAGVFITYNYSLNMDGSLDDVKRDTIEGLGTATVTVNGVANENKTEYYNQSLEPGATYKIDNIQAADDYIYVGQSSYEGTLTASTTVVLPYITKQPCTITYDDNGATMGSVEAQSGFEQVPLTLPTCNSDPYVETDFYKVYLVCLNYMDKTDASARTMKTLTSRADFLGWYTAAEGGDRVGGGGDSYTPTGDITLYAHWSDMPAVILNTPTRENCIFTGWYSAETGGEKVGDAEDSYIPSESTIWLYAHWSCTITYYGNGATYKPITSKTVEADSKMSLASNFQKSYWVQFRDRGVVVSNKTSIADFLGWYTAAEGGDKIGDGGANYTPTGDITLYAHWGDMPAITLLTLENYGYTFDGWWSSDFYEKYGDVGDSYVPTENIMMWAHWIPINLMYIGNNQLKTLYCEQTPVQYIFKGTTMIYNKG